MILYFIKIILQVLITQQTGIGHGQSCYSGGDVTMLDCQIKTLRVSGSLVHYLFAKIDDLFSQTSVQ